MDTTCWPWHPPDLAARSPEEPLDIQETIEAYLRELHAGYHVLQILVDPWQLMDMCTRLQKDRFPIEPYPQTVQI